MLNLKGPEGDLGVIVARFQTPQLTIAHRDLIETVKSRHKKFVIVLGISPVIPSTKNPLDAGTRFRMIQEFYPDTEVQFIQDCRSDTIWSFNLDRQLRIVHPHEEIILYGARDSFIEHYVGKFKTVELTSNMSVSGTETRKEAFHNIRPTEDFRRGICYATANSYPKNVLCVDVAVIDVGKSFRVLLARKAEDNSKWCFIGGHVGVGNETAEGAGRREVSEESGAFIGQMDYIGTSSIKDWRYEGIKDSIFTIFYAGHYISGPLDAADDIDEVKWFDVIDLNKEIMVSEHQVLLDMFMKYVIEYNRRLDY